MSDVDEDSLQIDDVTQLQQSLATAAQLFVGQALLSLDAGHAKLVLALR